MLVENGMDLRFTGSAKNKWVVFQLYCKLKFIKKLLITFDINKILRRYNF